jgi:iron complex outermembrane recepter protein
MRCRGRRRGYPFVFIIMQFHIFSARPSVLVLACATAFPVLAQTLPTLPETVVTATRFAEDRDTLPMGVSVITPDDIRASGATTVNEAVMRLLGVPGRLDYYGGANYTLDLRGFGETTNSNQVVVVDGQRLNEADLGMPLLAGIPIESIERIEVLRGSGAVLYGEGATGGVIVITTKAGLGKDRRNNAKVYGGVGSNDLRELRASATLVSRGFSVDVSGQRRDTDNHRDNFRAESDAASITAQWSNDAFRVGIRHSQDAVDTRLPGGLTIAQFEANPSQTNTPNDWARIRNTRDGLFAEALLGNWQLAGETGWRAKQLRSASYDYDVDANSYGLRARHESLIGDVKNQLVIGHDYSRWAREAYGLTSNHKSRGWYLQDDVTLASGTRFSGGVRTERMDKDADDGSSRLADRQNVWELGISHPLSSALRTWGRLGRSFRLANVDEFNFTNPAVAIRAQTSRDAEVGWSWKQVSYQLEARAYRNVLTDEIGYDPLSLGTGRNVNFDPTRRQGLEVEGRWAVTRELALNANLNFRSAIFRSGGYAGNDVPLVARETLALRAHWKPAEGHRVTGGVNWVGARYADFLNQCRMPSYTTADVRYARQWDNVELSLGVNNMFDRQYYTLGFGCSGGQVKSVYPEAGRTFTAALRMSF